MKLIDEYILKLLSKNPVYVTFVITMFSTFFAYISAYLMAMYFDSYIQPLDEYSFFVVKFTAFIIPLALTPFIAYKLVDLGHNRNVIIEHLDYLSKYDDLTTLKNRRYALELANNEYELSIRHGIDFSAMIIDFDDFKTINDTYGHLVGDIALQQVSSLISSNIRSSDIFGRYGGDEFILFCPHSNSVVAQKIAQKIINALNKELLIQEYSIKVSVSIGISSLDNTTPNKYDLESLITNADKALFDSKDKGKNCFSLYNNK